LVEFGLLRAFNFIIDFSFINLIIMMDDSLALSESWILKIIHFVKQDLKEEFESNFKVTFPNNLQSEHAVQNEECSDSECC
jgi:hypothetical protein